MPRIRWKPEVMQPHPQLDLFRALQAVELPLPATPSVSSSGLEKSTPAPAIADSAVSDTSTAPSGRPIPGAIAADDVILETGRVRVWYVPNHRAKSYRLALRPDGTGRCTVPKRGSLADARRFVERSRGWLATQWMKRSVLPAVSRPWQAGTLVWFRGQPVPLEVVSLPDHPVGEVKLADFSCKIPTHRGPEAVDLRRAVEHELYQLARRELPVHVKKFVAATGIEIARVSVRNQRTRWGSCSRRGLISLNWRLIQTPDFVRDYIILHELAHRRHLNHSTRFWDEVERLCPEWKAAEAWIRQHGRELL